MDIRQGFQSTRPRGARRYRDIVPCLPIFVSIHAPAWGATIILWSFYFKRFSFNPRARVGRDVRTTAPVATPKGFQSTRPRGARLMTKSDNVMLDKFQSTRPRGARHWKQGIDFCGYSFNPRARVGRDSNSLSLLQWMRCFNPRARVGRDSDAAAKHAGNVGFNPRARVGRDGDCRARTALSSLVSIHAPAWGATRSRMSPCRLRICFNPRARVGRDA